MGNTIFVILHFIAMFTLPFFLFVTIPAHLVYLAASRKKVDPHAPTNKTHLLCPKCQELVKKEASICKHCGHGLIPQ